MSEGASRSTPTAVELEQNMRPSNRLRLKFPRRWPQPLGRQQTLRKRRLLLLLLLHRQQRRPSQSFMLPTSAPVTLPLRRRLQLRMACSASLQEWKTMSE